MKIIFLLIVALIVIGLLFGWYRTYKTHLSPNAKLFLTGTAPIDLAGFYKGSVTGYTGPWQGKKFEPSTATGVNVFEEGDKIVEKYPFKTYNVNNVLKIDYNVAGNPLWLRFVLDELVQIDSGHYLGKLNIRTVPGMTFALGYFRLEK